MSINPDEIDNELLSWIKENRRNVSFGDKDQNQSIRDFCIKGSRITKIPDGLYSLNIRSLSICNTSITEISESIHKLTLLRSLTIRNNRLRRLPESIGKLHNLRILELDDNDLLEPPKINGLQNLECLTIGFNKRLILKDVDWFFPKITDLHIANANLTEVPRFIANLKGLRILGLHCNHIKNIDNISDLTELRNLYLSCNFITEIPDFIKNFKKLERFFIDKNLITYVPDFLSELKNLFQVWLDGNPIEEVSDYYMNYLLEKEKNINS